MPGAGSVQPVRHSGAAAAAAGAAEDLGPACCASLRVRSTAWAATTCKYSIDREIFSTLPAKSAASTKPNNRASSAAMDLNASVAAVPSRSAASSAAAPASEDSSDTHSGTSFGLVTSGRGKAAVGTAAEAVPSNVAGTASGNAAGKTVDAVPGIVRGTAPGRDASPAMGSGSNPPSSPALREVPLLVPAAVGHLLAGGREGVSRETEEAFRGTSLASDQPARRAKICPMPSISQPCHEGSAAISPNRRYVENLVPGSSCRCNDPATMRG